MALGRRGQTVWSRWRSRTRLSTGRRVLAGIGTLLLLLGGLGVAAHYRAPGSTTSLAITSVSPYLSALAVLAAICFAAVRAPLGIAAATVALAVVAWTVALQAPAFVAATAPSDSPTTVVMTSNLKLGSADPAAVVKAARSHGVDVLMLEELTPQSRDALRTAGLDRTFGYHVADPRPTAAGTGLWSRYPLTAPRIREDLGFSFVSATVHLPGTSASTTLAALHVHGPVPQQEYSRWAADMRAYPGVLRALPGSHVLVGGDFNSTPDAAQFRAILAAGYADGARQAGAGLTPTWPADRWYPPLLSIDHVLTRGAVATSADSVEIPGSDHRALVVSVRLAP